MSDQTEQPGSDQPGAETTPPEASSIPASDIAAGYTGESSTFEPQEDVPAADAASDAGTDAATEADAATDRESQSGTGPRSTEATALSGEDRSIFQSHWDDFAGHVD